MCICLYMYLRFYEGGDIKFARRNNLSECKHKYLMCSISPCKASGVCVRALTHVCVCTDSNYLAASRTPIEEAREGE